MAGEEMQQRDAYVVLARKYRSRTFGELIGQEALVRTLGNAIAAQRIHHAYVLTGIRGVGKTSTARLLAMALNCENGPAVTWAEDDTQVLQIRSGTHPDVLEFDAASNRSVEDISRLFEGINYAPMVGRCKVYIIDEVHMLSGTAFNALLKTLEEPPPGIKFIFATTEVQKIPVTVLSRCQRFDLKRIPAAVLQAHFTAILEKERIPAEAEAVAMVAKAADGSVRDGLSLLDQAMALAHGERISSQLVQDMLGLVDRVRVYDLLETLLDGQPAKALAMLDEMYAGGQDAQLVVQGLLDALHLVTRLKIVPGLLETSGLSELEKTRGGVLAGRLSTPGLSRAYQLLVQAAQEIKAAERPYEALSMAAVRVAYLAPLPPLERLLDSAAPVVQAAVETLPGQSVGAMALNAVTAPVMAAVQLPPVREEVADNDQGPAPWDSEAAPPVEKKPNDWRGMVERLRRERTTLAAALAQQVRCMMFDADACRMTVVVEKGLHDAKDLVRQLKEAVKELTGEGWQVQVQEGTAEGVATLREVRAEEGAQRRLAAADTPLVREVMSVFPGAVVEDVSLADA